MQKYILLYTLIGWLMVGINPVLAKSNSIHDSLQILRFEVNGIPFSMQRVEGGVFVMGAHVNNIVKLFLLIFQHIL
jgi:hypothetical protein